MDSFGDHLLDPLIKLALSPRLEGALRAALVIVITLVLAKLLGRLASNLLERAGPQHQMVGRRAAYYSVLGIGVISALHELGFSIQTLLGAAGIVTVALGFAAQTSASNLISGLFLIGERPFVVGDVVRIGTTTGEVLSIDWLSVKLRTFDNLYVRVPNETVVKSEVFNLTFFPIRRLELKLGLPYSCDIKRIGEAMLDVAHEHPLCLEEPKPTLFIDSLGNSMVELQLFVWSARENLIEMKSSLLQQIKLELARAGVEMPPAARTVFIDESTPRSRPAAAARDSDKVLPEP